LKQKVLHILKKMCFPGKTTPFEFFVFFNMKKVFADAKK
jgi:hypothetical protein